MLKQTLPFSIFLRPNFREEDFFSTSFSTLAEIPFLTERCWEFFLPALFNGSPFSGKSNLEAGTHFSALPHPTPAVLRAGRLLQALNRSTAMSPDPAVSGKFPGQTYGKHV